MNLDLLRPGHRIRTRDGRDAEILDVRNGVAIQVAYLRDKGGSFGILERTGDEEVLSSADVEALLGALPPSDWRRELTVVLHYAPESEEGPAEYRAETLSGTPNDVMVRGGHENSAQEALNRLLGGLALMGFRGAVRVDDAVGEGFDRYEVEVTDSF